jgi:p-cumate 2,3-dioxygenase beta subunit
MGTAENVSIESICEFLYHEAALLDEWKLEAWEKLLTDDATYYVPPNDQPESDHRNTLYTIADDRERIRQRVIRLMDPSCHAEFPHSRTRRMINNIRITERDDDELSVAANFVCYRFRRHERVREYVGCYQYRLVCQDDFFLIKNRRVVVDAEELGSLGSVSFIL